MDYDIIIYALVAVLILARLWAVFGQRNTEDRERPNPFATPPVTNTANAGAQTPAVVPFAPKPLLLAPASLAGGLAQIKEALPGFDERQFLQTVRQNFTLILDAFAKGDLTPSAALLGPDVLPHFQAAIDARQQAGQSMDHMLLRIRDAECVSARVADKQALITVRFVSEQQHTLRDAGGAVVADSGGKPEETTDFWSFARDTQKPDAVWVLVETRS